MKASEFFDLPESLAAFAADFPADLAPWEWLNRIGPALADPARDFGTGRLAPPGVHVSGRVWFHVSVKFPAYATIMGPAWIGPGTEIRPGAFIRGNVIVGAGAVLGNSCEYKNCLLLDHVQTAHFNYVGDSVLGNNAHLGAGVICSNLRLDQAQITLRLPGGPVATGLRKLGAIVGDGVEVGCNAVLNPGTLLGKRSLVTPCTAFGGYLPPATIAHARQQVGLLPRRE